MCTIYVQCTVHNMHNVYNICTMYSAQCVQYMYFVQCTWPFLSMVCAELEGGRCKQTFVDDKNLSTLHRKCNCNKCQNLQPYMSWERCTMMIFLKTISLPPTISPFCQTLPSLIMFLLILLKCNLITAAKEVLIGSILPTQFTVVSFNHLKCGSSLAQPYQPTCSSSWIRRHLSLSAEYNGTLSQLLIAHIWQSYLRRSVKSVIVHLPL